MMYHRFAPTPDQDSIRCIHCELLWNPQRERENCPGLKRPEKAIMRDIARTYGALSPENLFCDGEISHSAGMRRARGLQAQLRKLFKELGREVDELEAYRSLQP